MKTFFTLLVLSDALIIMWGLHKLYHKLFTVSYSSYVGYIKEIAVTFVFAGLILYLVPDLLGMKINAPNFLFFVYLIAILIGSIYLIFRCRKK